MKKIHPKQQQLLELLLENQEHPLSIRELQVELGLSSPSLVHHHILQLEKKGYLKRDPYNTRNYKIVKSPKDSEITYLNLYGNAQCGPDGTLLSGNPIKRVPFPLSHFSIPVANLFLMHAKGDSMIPRIHEGDLVIVEKSSTPSVGDVIVCTVNCKVMIKKFSKNDSTIVLLSYNEEFYDPIVVPENEFIAEGIVKGILKLSV